MIVAVGRWSSIGTGEGAEGKEYGVRVARASPQVMSVPNQTNTQNVQTAETGSKEGELFQ